jgi:tetratricopeptide (TPR) repeat protein
MQADDGALSGHPRVEATSIVEAMDEYEASLHALSDGTAVALLPCLNTRDRIATQLREHPAIAGDLIEKLATNDMLLKDKARSLRDLSSLFYWRTAVGPPPEAWWWYLDENTASPLWAIMVGLFLAISLSISADISRRFLSTGPDFYSVFSTVSQVVLTFLAGSSLTRVGRDWLRRALLRIGIQGHMQHRWRAGVAAFALCVVGGLWFSLPTVARHYDRVGFELHERGKLRSAIENYERAVSLAPDDSLAHYNLANALQDALDERALAEYVIAIKADPRLYRAYNNLATLLILKTKDYPAALHAINVAFDQAGSISDDDRYILFKNRAWANFELKNYRNAEADARTALKIRGDGAAASCVLAAALQQSGTKASAKDIWRDCRTLPYRQGIEDFWLSAAEEQK